MSHEADWSLDFCLSCDKQSSGGPYCSQACRLADLGKGLYDMPCQNQNPIMEPASLLSNRPPRTHAYVLPPAFDFRQESKMRSKSSPSLIFSRSLGEERLPRIRHHSFSSASTMTSSNETLLESSHSRLSSVSTSTSRSSQYYMNLSDEARQQLQQYEEAFDYTRYQKVRSSL